MATTRRAYTGGATSTTTTSAIAASGTTSFTITAYTGWPYGSDPFFVVVEPGTASEEKILVTRTGSTDTTINIASDSERAQDGTSAVAHSSGSIVFPVFTALDADEANELTSSWSTKGDLVSYGSSTFETLGVGSDGQFLRADSGETSGLAWETFNNTLGSGAAVEVPGTFSGGDVLQAAEMNALPGGVLDIYNTTSAITFGTGFPGTAHMDVTATFDSSRRYRVTVQSAFIYNNSAAGVFYIDLFIGSLVANNRCAVSGLEFTSASQDGFLYLDYIVNGTLSGTYTFYASFRAGAGTAEAYATTSGVDIPLQMSVEDIGTV